MGSFWNYTSENGGVRADCGSMSLTVTPEQGVTLTGLEWKDHPDLYAPVKLRTVYYAGRYYSRWNLNQLANPLFDTGESDIPDIEVVGADLKVKGVWRVHDLEVEREVVVNGETGGIAFAERISKNGPGRIKIQAVGEFYHPLGDYRKGPQAFVRLPVAAGRERLWDFQPAGNAIQDQDNHAVNRCRVLTGKETEVGRAGSSCLIRYILERLPACAAVWTRPPHMFILHLYGSDVMLDRGGTSEFRYRVEMVAAAKTSAPVRCIVRRLRNLRDEAENLKSLVKADSADRALDALHKLRYHSTVWKLREFDWYQANAEIGQAAGLLKDAKSVWGSWEKYLPETDPEPGEILYETKFDRLPDDWHVFGFGRMRADDEMGLHVDPNTTMNLWTKMMFEGDYSVEFDYQATSDVPGSGTFLQLSARSINPRSETDFMASATGHMPDYNFGIRCYHFSFNRHSPDRRQQICNFRKTGKSFYLLAQVPEPLGPSGRWYNIRMARRANSFLFRVDGRPVLYYADEGNQGPVYGRGHIGLRNWGRQAAWFRNFRVYRPA